MYRAEGMKERLRKGDIGEALFREWFDRTLGELFVSRGLILEQQGYNPGGFVDLGEKKHLKEKNDPDFAIYSRVTGRPLAGISINTQKKPYNVDSAMGKNCVRCPRVLSCADGKEENLWYNKYNLPDYDKFRWRFGVDVCMVTLLVSVDGIAKWADQNRYENFIHAYVFNGGASLPEKEKAKINEIVYFLRHDKRKGWERPIMIKWILHSELEEISQTKPDVQKGRIPYWTAGGRVERGRPRPVCCVNLGHARGEQELINWLKKNLYQPSI